MIVSNQFVFIHIHKTGGQFINKAILDYIPDAKCIGYHYPLRLLPEQYVHLPVIAFVRNPWDWYVSWYMFNKSRATINPIYKVLSHQNTSGFNKTIQRMINLGDGSQQSKVYLSSLIEKLPDTIEGNRSSGITKDCIKSIRNCGVGYYSWLVNRMLGNSYHEQTILVGRYEHLRSEFLNLLLDVAAPVSTEMKNYLLTGVSVNQSIRKPYQSYFDEGTKLLVQQKDTDIIGRYGYQY